MWVQLRHLIEQLLVGRRGFLHPIEVLQVTLGAWAGWPVRAPVLDANLGSEGFSPAEGKLFKPYTRRYFSAILFLLSTITLRRIRLIRVW